MPTTTSRLGLTEPVGADAVSELRVAITNNATILDNAAIVTEGTLAARPTTSLVFGQTYYATDVGVGTWYFYTGSAWQTILVAGAWATITLSSMTTATGGVTAAYRFEGDVIRLRGDILNNSGITLASGTGIVVLPITLTTNILALPCAASSATNPSLEVTTNGTVKTNFSWPNATTIALNGVTFPIT